MKILKFALFILILNVQYSCSKDSDPSDNKPEVYEDKAMIGTWSGQVTQLGSAAVLTLKIDKLEKDQLAGTAQRSCFREVTYKGRTGNTFGFAEVVPTASMTLYCGGQSSSIVKMISKDVVEYTWTDATDTRNVASGKLTRQ
jgi:hypothetical protein